jgi:smad nuclear-interacting protein 1
MSDDYKMEDRSRRDDASPRPSKRRRRSEDRDESLPRNREKDNRSRSPYRKEKRDRDERRRKSRSPRKSKDKDKRSSKRDASLSRSRSPPRRKDKYDQKRSKSRSRSREGDRKSRKPLPSQEVAFNGEGGTLNPETGAIDKPIVKEKPNFKPTGLLAKEANTVTGTKIVLKYNEPPEARKPSASQKWQLYIFKGDDIVDELPLYTQSCWLLGREAAVVDVHVEHPSASKQHAVIQFRHSVKVNEFGEKTNIVRPYLIDLESANGTMLNGEKIKDSRYYEIRDKDMVKIGLSEREYVFMLPPSG